MKEYKAILFDADETLLDFSLAEQHAFCDTAVHFGFNDPMPLLAVYTKANKDCWLMFERGEIDKDYLTVRRYELFFERTGIVGHLAPDWNEYYKNQLSENGFLLEGALELLKRAGKKYTLYVITNGLARTQYSRFKKAGITHFFEAIFISEELGAQKPQKEYFNGVYERIPFSPQETLVVGDSLSSDIKGGIDYGIDTCFFNPKKTKTTLTPTYTVSNYAELMELLQI